MALRELQIAHHPPLLLLFRSLSADTTAAATVDGSFTATVDALSRVLSDHRLPHHDLETALLPFASAAITTPSLLDDVLKRCHHLPNPCHRLFLFASSLPGFVPSPLSRRLLLRSLLSSRLFPLFWAHLSDLPRPHLHPSLFHLSFFSYSQSRLPSDAVRSFQKMVDFGITPVLDDVHVLLHALCQHGHAAEAQSFFHRIRANASLAVTSKTYTILIQGWARAGESVHACRLFDEMRERGGVVVDVPAYNALLGALCKGGEMDEAGRRLKEMRMVHGLEPDAGSYAVFICAYCDGKDAHSALRMLENMRRKGLAPNVFTYNRVIRLLCEKEEKADEAYELLDEMLQRGVKPDVWSYNRILALHCKLREANKATRLLKRMEEDGCSPDKHTYNMLIKMLIGVGRIDRAEEVWDGMEKRGFYPCVSSYAVMIHGLCRARGRAEEASRYFEVMVDDGVPPYASTCVLLRGELMRLGLKEKVSVLSDKMRRSSCCTIQELASVMESGKEMEKGA